MGWLGLTLSVHDAGNKKPAQSKPERVFEIVSGRICIWNLVPVKGIEPSTFSLQVIICNG